MNRRLVLFAAGSFGVLFLGGCVDRQAQREAKETQKLVSNPVKLVSVQTVREQTITDTVEITGGVTTGEDTSIGPKTAGRLVAVYVKDGDAVSAGQLLASQDASTLNSQLSAALAGLSSARSQLSQALSNAAVGPSKSSAAVAAAQAQLKSAQAALQKARVGARPEERAQADWAVRSAKSSLDTAKADLDRQRDLYAQGAIAKQKLDQAQNTYETALTAYNSALQSKLIQTHGTRPEDMVVAVEAVRSAEENLRSAQAQKKLDVLLDDQVQSAQAGVQSAQSQVAIAKQAISDAEIRAPFSGQVSGKPMQVGTVAVPGSTVVRVIGGQGAYFEGQVSEDVVAKLTVGSPVEIHVDALGGQAVPGAIAAISPLGTDVGRLFNIRVTFKNVPQGLRPGMYAQGVVQIRKIPNAIVVPVAAIVKNGGENAVFVVEGSKAKLVPVELGIQEKDHIQVTGLQPGQQLVVGGQDSLSDGAEVQVDKSQPISARTENQSFGG